MKSSREQGLVCTRCKRCHPSVLHLDPRQNNDSKPVVRESNNDHAVSATSSATHMVAGNSSRQALPIVPVRLKSKISDKYIVTYAFLDSGSTARFCLEEIITALNVEGRKTQINLLTIGQETIQESYVVSGLGVSSPSSENVLELSPVFTQPTLPVFEKDIVLSDDIQNWSYLHDIPLNRIDAKVGLLIGVNVPKAMEPWDVVPSVDNGPFAVKTLLGWVI